MKSMKLSEELQWRGFKNQTTFKDLSMLDKNPITFYWGVDPSADSMHIGQLAMTVMVKHLIKSGHKAILLVGGATGQIGDPDGKNEERDLKSFEEIKKNRDGIVAQYERIFEGLPFEVVDNYDWFKEINYIDFLRNVGKYFSMSQLLDREFVKSRVGEGGAGISYAEFSYSLIQGYDFLHLYREKGVTLQVSGADQWGNSLAGVELVRKLEGREAHVYTAPLIINKATGKKFGKSEEGAVWLDENKTSVYKFYQFWLNCDDKGVVDYIKIYTLLSPEEINELERQVREAPEKRQAQKILAFEVTKLAHGEERAKNAVAVTEVLFGKKSITELDQNVIDLLANEVPNIKKGRLSDGLVSAGVVSSKGEFRRLVASGAISVNGTKIIDDYEVDEVSLIKKGKNQFSLVV